MSDEKCFTVHTIFTLELQIMDNHRAGAAGDCQRVNRQDRARFTGSFTRRGTQYFQLFSVQQRICDRPAVQTPDEIMDCCTGFCPVDARDTFIQHRRIGRQALVLRLSGQLSPSKHFQRFDEDFSPQCGELVEH